MAVGWLWGLVFPIIKILWTSSYVLFAGGWSLLLLALFYWVIDVKGYRRWAFPFVVIGMNAITIYFLQSFVNFEEISRFFLGGRRPTRRAGGAAADRGGRVRGQLAAPVVPLPPQDLLQGVTASHRNVAMLRAGSV